MTQLVKSMKPGTSVRGYMCRTDLDYQTECQDGVRVHPTLAALKEARHCWKECGIVEVKLTFLKVVEEGNASRRCSNI